MPRAQRRPRATGGSRQRGMSLLELMLVLALVALIAGGVMSGSGMLGGTRLRSDASLILTAVRLAMTQSNSNGLPVRLVFDLEHQRIWLEETRSRMLRSNPDAREDDLTGGAAAATESERLAAEEAKRILDGPREPPASFSVLPALGVDPADPNPGRALGSGIQFARVQTEHDPVARTSGRAYLYFWPGGGTEKAVITLRHGEEGDDGKLLSVVVSALTGRAQIVKGEVDFERPDDAADLGEREVE